MGKRLDLVGQTFNYLTVLEFSHMNNYNQSHWTCKCSCGNICEIMGAKLKNGHTKSCGCYGKELLKNRIKEKNPRWKGGKSKTKNGYVRIRNVITKKDELEHIKVMEEYLDRKLVDKENVHHKNGIRDDNRIENLELWTSSQPSGQRVIDLINWAKEILRQYSFEELRLK
jgi:hypothetical protein